jgi:hypothetical protein
MVPGSLLVAGDRGFVGLAERSDPTWGPFIRAADLRGWRLASPDLPADAIVSVNARRHTIASTSGLRTPRCRRILIQWESPAVQPSLFQNGVTKQFDLVLSMSPLWPRAQVGNWFHWPQGQDWQAAKELSRSTWYDRLDAVAMVNRNVVSANRRSLYHLRRQVAGLSGVRGVALAGHGWPATRYGDALDAAKGVLRQVRERDLPSLGVLRKTLATRPTSVMGSIDRKGDYLSSFRFALVIENSLDYVSEKLFDVLAAGCVPIYVGPPLHPFGLDENLVVRAHPSFEGVQTAIANVSDDDVERTLGTRQSLLNDGLDPWLPANTMAALANRVCDFLEG